MKLKALVLGFACLVLISSPALAKIIHVPSDSSTIQAGINGAVTWDTVLVAPGTYYEHINFNRKAILLKSEKGADSTIISKLSDGLPMVVFNSGEGNYSILEGFTIQNANNPGGYGGGIYCLNHSSPTIRGNILKNNIGVWGGGILCQNYSSPTIENNTIIGNYAPSQGGGVSCNINSSPLIKDNLFVNNNAPYGGGIMCNQACAPTIRGNLFIKNSATTGGAICCWISSSPLIEHNTIDRNTSSSNSGAIRTEDSSPIIKNNILSNGTGYGIYAAGSSSLTITDCDVWRNASGDYFGCIPGVGCISSDPIFCDTASDNYYLFYLSPCVGAGEGGTDIGAFGVGCLRPRDVDVTVGVNVEGRAETNVEVKFYVRNAGSVSDTYDLDITNSLYWTIVPAHYTVLLDSGQVDTASFTVSIPQVSIGTSDPVTLLAVSKSDQLVRDSATLTVTCNAYSYHVSITRISDVPNDQGKQVRIDWTSFPSSDPLVKDFTIFRRIDSLLVVSSTLNPRIGQLLNYPPGRWEIVGTYPAFGETLYSATVPTLKDSTKSEGMYWSFFFIRAGTNNPTVYFDSPVDSGYSVDNLSPSPPSGLLARHKPAITRLTWSKCGSQDFDYYTLYRDTLAGFHPTLNNRVAFTIDSLFSDSTAQLGRPYYYLVSATDFSENESNPSNQTMGIRYILGDLNASGKVDVADIVYLISYLFKGGNSPMPLESGNVNCDGKVSVADVVYLINYLFKGGPLPCEPQ